MSDRYRKTLTKKWADPWFADLSPMAKLLLDHCITNDHVDKAGISELNDRQIAFETGINIGDLPAVFRELSEKVVRRENWTWVLNFTRHQAQNKDFRDSAREDAKQTPFYHVFIERYPEEDKKNKTNTPPIAPHEPTMCHQQEQEQEQKQEQTQEQEKPIFVCAEKKPTEKISEPPDGFEEFWTAYPVPPGRSKGSRKDALTRWKTMKPEERAEAAQILPVFISSDSWKRGFAPQVTKFLHQRLWESPPGNGTPPARGAPSAMIAMDAPITGQLPPGALTLAQATEQLIRRKEEYDARKLEQGLR